MLYRECKDFECAHGKARPSRGGGGRFHAPAHRKTRLFSELRRARAAALRLVRAPRHIPLLFLLISAHRDGRGKLPLPPRRTPRRRAFQLAARRRVCPRPLHAQRLSHRRRHSLRPLPARDRRRGGSETHCVLHLDFRTDIHPRHGGQRRLRRPDCRCGQRRIISPPSPPVSSSVAEGKHRVPLPCGSQPRTRTAPCSKASRPPLSRCSPWADISSSETCSSTPSPSRG